jgi:hypothetical protein
MADDRMISACTAKPKFMLKPPKPFGSFSIGLAQGG